MKISFHSHANAISFSYEKISTRTRFEKEAKGNSEMAYLGFCARAEIEHLIATMFQPGGWSAVSA